MLLFPSAMGHQCGADEQVMGKMTEPSEQEPTSGKLGGGGGQERSNPYLHVGSPTRRSACFPNCHSAFFSHSIVFSANFESRSAPQALSSLPVEKEISGPIVPRWISLDLLTMMITSLPLDNLFFRVLPIPPAAVRPLRRSQPHIPPNPAYPLGRLCHLDSSDFSSVAHR